MEQLFVDTNSNVVKQRGYVPLDPEGRSFLIGKDPNRFFLTELPTSAEAQALAQAIQRFLCWQVVTVPGRRATVAASVAVTEEIKRTLKLGCNVGTEYRFFPGRRPWQFTVVYTTTDFVEAMSLAEELNA